MKAKMNRSTELDPKSVTSEPTNSAGKEKREVASELSSPSLHSMDSGFFERGIKTMLSIRKSKRSLTKEKEKEGTGTWKGKRLSLRFPKSYENKTTVCNGMQEVGEKIEAEPIQGKPLSGKKQTHQCNTCNLQEVHFANLGPNTGAKEQVSHYGEETQLSSLAQTHWDVTWSGLGRSPTTEHAALWPPLH